MNNSIPKMSNDEWLSNAIRRLKLTPLKTAAILAIFNLVRNLSLAFAFDAWAPSARSRGLSAEPASWLIDLLFQPAILAYFCWIQYAFHDLLENLASEGILKSDDKLQSIATKSQELLKNQWLSRASTLVGVGFSMGFVFVFTMPTVQAPSNGWVGTHPIIAWAVLPVLFIATYALIMLILDLGILIFTLNKLFGEQGVRVEPLNPDNAGGFGSIGRFLANLGYGIGLVGLTFSVAVIQAPNNFSSDYILMLTLIFYLALAPLIFFLPLRSAHSAMLAYRNHLVAEISLEYDAVFDNLRGSRSSDPDDKEIILKKLRQLDETRNMIMQFPIWPFNTSSVRRFFGLTLSPLLPAAISLFMDWIAGLLL